MVTAQWIACTFRLALMLVLGQTGGGLCLNVVLDSQVIFRSLSMMFIGV
jgi:hypothetical protein